MSDFTGYYNALITEIASSNPTPSKILATTIAILTAQFIGSSQTIYKDDAAEVLRECKQTV